MSAIGDWLRRMGSAIANGNDAAEHHTDNILDLWDTLHRDTLNLINDLNDLKHFDFDPKWSTRVINVPRAVDGIQEVFDIIKNGLKERFGELFQAIETLKNALHDTVHHLPTNPDGGGIVTAIVDKFGATYVALTAFQKAYTKVTDIVEMIDNVKRRIETLDDLFLPQGSTKKTVDEHYRKRQRSKP